VTARRSTLFQRTGLTLAAALLLFSLFALLVTRWLLVQPVTERAAEELAALLELSAKVMVELPPWTRADYARHLREHHDLQIDTAKDPLAHTKARRAYLDYVEAALTRHFKRELHVLDDPAQPGWYWVDLPVGGRTVRLGFETDRLQERVPAAVVLIGAAGALLILITSLLLVRRVTLPLSRLSDAVRRFGQSQPFHPVPETGPAELADLARRINVTEQQIRELLENRTTLLAGISHDLRTPIARLQLEIELLPPDLEPQLVAGMRQDLEEMDNLIGRTLELARGLDRHDPPDTLPEDLLQQLSTDYARSGKQLLLEGLSGCALRVPGKPLRRVLVNLLDNALRYGGDSSVTLRLQCGTERAAIAVIDHGPGIPETEREAVLRPFYRLEGSRAKDTGGSGLGLAIAKQLCEAYGWRLTLANTPGGGLTVLVEVSAAPA
jgi:two-component system osmolarity sensor histidine kinase EnvZ